MPESLEVWITIPVMFCICVLKKKIAGYVQHFIKRKKEYCPTPMSQFKLFISESNGLNFFKITGVLMVFD